MNAKQYQERLTELRAALAARIARERQHAAFASYGLTHRGEPMASRDARLIETMWTDRADGMAEAAGLLDLIVPAIAPAARRRHQ